MEQEKQEKKESFKQKRSKKSYVIETIIVLFVMCAVCVGIGFLDVYGRERNLDTQLMMIIGDAFWVPGCFGICLWGLLFTASAGAFDMRRDIDRDVVPNPVDKEFTITGLGDNFSGHIIGFIGFDFS